MTPAYASKFCAKCERETEHELVEVRPWGARVYEVWSCPNVDVGHPSLIEVRRAEPPAPPVSP